MLQIQRIRDNKEEVIKLLEIKYFKDANKTVGEILDIDERYRKNLTELESQRNEMNKIAKSVGILIGKGDNNGAELAKKETSELKTKIEILEINSQEFENELNKLLVTLPNLPHSSVPAGKIPEDNLTVFSNELKINLPPKPLPHWELTQKHQLIDFEAGVKLTGAGFPVYKGKGARLQRALINFFLDRATAAGYLEIQPPILVNEESGFGTGQLPDKEGQMYYVTEDKLYLIPTAEVPITNLYRDIILESNELPIKNCGYTPCFRREAGSYGKDVRGLNRLHQFDKVEIVQVTQPENSYQTLEEMRGYVATLLDALELPYRILLLCGGDISFSSAKTYDFEVFSGAQGRWLEVSSVSNFENFQANRLKLRYREKKGEKPKLAHTLNGSALALPRIVAALLENNQQADGSIHIPKVLWSYTGFQAIN
jgi:seryl-tRNA synthetase